MDQCWGVHGTGEVVEQWREEKWQKCFAIQLFSVLYVICTISCILMSTCFYASQVCMYIQLTLFSYFWCYQARYKQSLDPTVDEVKKLCTSLRRNAKEERVLFHYNGHGVPRPTVNGEIWVFNKVCHRAVGLKRSTQREICYCLWENKLIFRN